MLAPLFDGEQQVRHDIGARFGAEVAFAVDADGDVAGVEVALADDQHGVGFHLFGTGDLGFDGIAARVDVGTDSGDA